MLARLESQSPEERAAKSLVIQRKLLGLDAFKRARCVYAYSALPEEVDTRLVMERALAAGKHVAVPLVRRGDRTLRFYAVTDLAEDLVPGAWGILEPRPDPTRRVSPRQADCVVLPGLAFDHDLNRLGRGGGFYDRFLETLNPGVVTVGLGFGFQIVPRIPGQPHDQKVDRVLTEEKHLP